MTRGLSMQLHRLFSGFQFGGLFLAAVLVETFWNRLRARSRDWLVSLGVLLLLVPAWIERYRYFRLDRQMIEKAGQASRAEEGPLRELFEVLVQHERAEPGRIFAGVSSWGAEFRIGEVPVYSLLGQNLFPVSGYAGHSMS